jgi:hypothetical protein
MVASKSESVAAYSAEIDDGWIPFVVDTYRLGHDRWHYLVPDDIVERSTLRDLCGRTLAFENNYLSSYGGGPGN